MKNEPHVAIRVLGASLILGIFGDLLFHDAAWGVNISIWVLGLGAGAFFLSRWLGRPIPKVVSYSAPVILLFAACFGFRDAPELKWANSFCLFFVIGALLVRTKQGALAQSSIYDLTLKAVGAWFKLTADFAHLVTKDVPWITTETSKKKLKDVTRGVLIAAPLLLVFGGLFASADEAFRGLITRIFDFQWLDGQWLFQTVAIFLFCGVLAAGVYRMILSKSEDVPLGPPVAPNDSNRLGITEVSIVLGLLNDLFGIFVWIQAQYLFGGVRHLKLVEGLTYAEYARHGFFELAAVATCAIATILGFHALLKQPELNQRKYSINAGVLAVLVGVVMASAFQRMNLYINFAGLTELRVYTTAFMVWIAAVLIWLAATVLRGERRRFAFGALVSGLAGVLALNVINPDAAIARFNLSGSARQVDLSYLESLSLDAAPVIAATSGNLSPKQAAELRGELRKRWTQEVDADWRGSDYARWQFASFYRRRI